MRETLLCALLISAPLFFGSVEPWALALMETLACAALLAALRQSPEKHPPRAAGAYALIALAGYMALQSMPMPPSLLSLLSPKAHDVYSGTLWALGPGRPASVSLYRAGTLSEALRTLSYALAYIAFVWALSGRSSRSRAIRCVVYFCGALSVLSVIQHLVAPGSVMFFRQGPAGSSPFGPFVNRNHYAALMGMVFPLALSMFLHMRPRTVYDDAAGQLTELLRSGMAGRHLLFGLSAAAIALGILVSASRTGVAVMVVSVVIVTLYASRRDRTSYALGAVLIIAVGYFIYRFGLTEVIARYSEMAGPDGALRLHRPALWELGLRIWRDFPLTGAGAGSFAAVSPMYMPVQGGVLIDHAHNDYVQALAGTGIAGAALMAAFIARSARAAWASPEDSASAPAVRAGATVGALAMLLHSTMDFNFQIPACGLYFVFMTALAVSSARPPRPEEANPTRRQAYALAFVALAGVVVFNAWQHGRPAIDGSKDEYAYALALDPLDTATLLRAAAAAAEAGDSATARTLYGSAVMSGRDNASAMFGYAGWLYASGQRDDAFAYVKDAVSFDSSKLWLSFAYMALWGVPEPDMAGAMPADDGGVALSRLADLLAATGNRDEALKAYRRAVAVDAAAPMAYYGYYRLLADSGMSGEALDVVADGARRHPESFALVYSAAYRLMAAGRAEEACAFYGRSKALKPDNSQIEAALRRCREAGFSPKP